ncbi:MAG: trypsin-like peptidase domain-containing protein [Planctomycetota bacterium]|nr:trypsin-like peptidase domain-containing protein [Planctomycetota bacterium]
MRAGSGIGVRIALIACIWLALLAIGVSPAGAKGSLTKVESEFEKAIDNVTPATCVCLPQGVDPRLIFGTYSGVIMSRKGLVLSDGDVGIHADKVQARGEPAPQPVWSDDVEIRLPNLKGKGFQSYRAKVIHRDRELDTALLRMENPPSSLKYLEAGNSDDLKVGDFTFAMGNSFGLAAEAPPTLTAGVVASLTPSDDKSKSAWAHIITSAAVNQGVNGGPLVDIHGHLVGTISSAVGLVGGNRQADDPELAYAYMGKVVPVNRLRAHYARLPECEELFPADQAPDPKLGESGALAMVFHRTARRAYRSLVSLAVTRDPQLSLVEPTQQGMVQIPRYLGPVSGVLIDREGHILTSLYNLANLTALVMPGLGPRLPENARVQAGMAGIKSVVAHLPDGRAVSARVLSRHEGLGIALLKAEVSATTTEASTAADTVTSLEPAIPAPEDTLQAGRFVLAIGHPFGAKRLDDPLLTVGILSKQHDPGGENPWAAQWQTDAGVTDANAGGAAVDLRGRVMGVLTIWSSTQHGRNSGIGFIVPWNLIEPALESMKTGRDFRPPFFGLTWKAIGGDLTTVLDTVLAGQAAANAGLKPGDEIVKIDGTAVVTPSEVKAALRDKWSGDAIAVTVKRAGKEIEYTLTLGARE